MMNKNLEMYGALEIKQNNFNFTVTKIVNNKLIVVYKKNIQSSKDLLDNQGKVIDVKQQAKLFNSIIEEYEHSHNGFKLFNISLILPINAVKVSKKYEEINIANINDEPNQITKNHILDLINIIKINPINPDHKVIESKAVTWMADHIPTELNEITNMTAKKLGLTAKTFEIPLDIFNSHAQIIKKTGKNIMFLALSTDGLFWAIEQNNKSIKPVLIINWGEQQIEAAYYQNGGLENFRLINKGVQNISEELAGILKIKISTAHEYLTRLVDYSSNNNHGKCVFQKWDQQDKNLKKYSANEIQKIVGKIINHLYKEIKDKFSSQIISQTNLITYNFGIIRDIPGVETLLKNGISLANEYVFDEFVLGMRNTIGLESFIGIVKKSRDKNNLNQTKNITSVAEVHQKNMPPNYQPNLFNPTNQPVSQLIQPQYLLNQGILIDSKKYHNK